MINYYEIKRIESEEIEFNKALNYSITDGEIRLWRLALKGLLR